MEKHSEWQQDEHEKLMELRKQNPDWSYQQLADKLTEIYGTLFTFNAVRNRIRRNKPTYEELVKTSMDEIKRFQDNHGVPNYKENYEILPDGSHKSDKLVRMTEAQKKDNKFLLEAHGYDDSWEIITAKSSMWNQHNKQDGTVTLYSSKITVKPKDIGFNWDKFLELIDKKPSIHVKKMGFPRGERYLTIPLFDLHFGINDCNHYKTTQAKVLNILDNHYKETLIILGSDLFHHNDHRNRTASGREIEHADMTLAWEEAEKFYSPIFYKALETCDKVSVMFIKGNHSESLEWAFTKMIKKAFPQLEVDDSFRERKAHIMGNIMVGSTHGDKANLNKMAELFSTEFPLLWARAKTREVLCGDKHHEEVKDKGGIVVRQLSTRNKIDRYHEDNGYTMAHKRFQVFEYSRDELESIFCV